METTFQEVRQRLGFETQRQWSEKALRRTAPALLGLFSLVTLLAHRHIAEGADRPKSSLVRQGSPDILRRSGVGEKAVVGAGGDFLQVIAGKRHCKSPTRVHGTANRCDLLRSVNGQSPAKILYLNLRTRLPQR